MRLHGAGSAHPARRRAPTSALGHRPAPLASSSPDVEDASTSTPALRGADRAVLVVDGDYALSSRWLAVRQLVGKECAHGPDVPLTHHACRLYGSGSLASRADRGPNPSRRRTRRSPSRLCRRRRRGRRRLPHLRRLDPSTAVPLQVRASTCKRTCERMDSMRGHQRRPFARRYRARARCITPEVLGSDSAGRLRLSASPRAPSSRRIRTRATVLFGVVSGHRISGHRVELRRRRGCVRQPVAKAPSRCYVAPEARRQRSGGCGRGRLTVTTGTDIAPRRSLDQLSAPTPTPGARARRLSRAVQAAKSVPSATGNRIRTVQSIPGRSGSSQEATSRKSPSRLGCRGRRGRRSRAHGDAVAFKHAGEARSLGGDLLGPNARRDGLASLLIRLRTGGYDPRRRTIGAGWRRCRCRWTGW